MEKLEHGSTAPDFSLFDQEGNNVVLADERGAWVVLFFSGTANSPASTALATALRNSYSEFEATSARIFCIFDANVGALKAFAHEHTIPYKILSDEKHRIAKRYGAYSGGLLTKGKFHPHTFIVDPEGKIEKIYTEVDPLRHAAEVLRDLAGLKVDKN